MNEQENPTPGILGIWSNMKLIHKLAFCNIGFMVVITLAIIFTINKTIHDNMAGAKKATVEHALAGVEHEIHERKDILEKFARYVSASGGIVNAIPPSFRAEESNRVQREILELQKGIDVERITLCRPHGGDGLTVVACTTGEKRLGGLIPMHPLCREAEKNAVASGFLLEGRQFILKVCSVIQKGGDTIAYLVIDDILDADLAQEIETSTGARIALLMHTEPNAAQVVTSAYSELIGRQIGGEGLDEVRSTEQTAYQPDFEVGGDVHMAAYRPLRGVHDEVIGTLMVLMPMGDVIGLKGNTMKAMATIGVLALIIGMVINVMLVVHIAAPLKSLLSTAQAIGKGNLTQRATMNDGNDEIGQLSNAFSRMQANLVSMVTQIGNSIELLESSSVELSASSRQQADGSMQQAAALTETSTTVEELAATSNQIAVSAEVVAELAKQSLAGMEKIRDNTEQEASRILTLGEKSQAIGDVVALIDDIAKQTNILALNATIEAERAGEAGKGFGVVAIEIRELAKNVAKSTKQIREIIKEIQDATNVSVLATENVGRAVVEGIDLSKQTAQSAKQISLVTQQQGNASEQVVSAIKQMSDVVGQAAAGSQQVADTAHKLVEVTSEQKRLIGQFRIR